jgi:hypothetical protein
MPYQRRWKFGEIEIVTSDFAFLATEISQVRRIESINVFTFLLGQWLGNQVQRSALIEMNREVTLSRSMPQFGRALGPENDMALIASLQSAFQAHRLHALRIAGRLSPRLLTANGASWKFEGAQIVQSDSLLRMRELTEFFHIREAAIFSRDIGRWLSEPASRATILAIHKAVKSAPLDDNQPDIDSTTDENVVADLFAAWENRELHLLKRRIRRGSDTEEASRSTPPRSPKRTGSSEIKTWIEIILEDQDDKPVAGIKYRLRITDGSVREGELDGKGSTRVDGIDPGMCEIMFPELDAKRWYRA